MSRFVILVLAAAIVHAAVGPAGAAGFARVGTAFSWEGTYTGARMSALGGADLAGVEAPDAVLVNPAPLVRGDRIAASYGRFEDFPLYDELETWAVAAGWNGWRLSACRSGYKYDSVLVRTAYNPEGTDTGSEMVEDMSLVGLSYEFGAPGNVGRAWRLAVGATYRHYRHDFDDPVYGSHYEGGTVDLGITASWNRRFDTGRFELLGAVVGQNISDTKIDYEGRDSALPRALRAGLSARTALDWPGRPRDMLAVLLAYSHVHRPGYRGDSDHIGMELVGGGLLALRYGTNDSFFDGLSGWGVGLILAERFMGPVSLRADWARLDTSSGYFEDLDVWGLEAAFTF